MSALVDVRTTIAQHEETIIGIGGMTQRRQHDAAGDHSAHDKRVDAVGPQDHIEIRAHEGADPALGDDYLTRSWRDTRMNPATAPTAVPATGTTLPIAAPAAVAAAIAPCADSGVRDDITDRPLLRDGYIGKLIASYDWLERELDVDSQIHIGHIALATTLSWLEFRELPGFRKYRPRLAAWLDGFEGRPSMRATPLSGETRD